MIYQLGPWQFNTELNLLYCEQSEKELDPLIVKLLTYFIKHPKAIIPRQQLIEDVWQQSFVDDNAINRAMSELRKHLQHPSLDEPLIKTHYRLGYSLILAAKTLDINQTTPVLPSQKKVSAKKRLLILCSSVVVLALTLSVYWYTQPQETTVLAPDFKLDVIDNGDIDVQEKRPLFSYNKEYLASSGFYLKQGVQKVHVRRLSDNKKIILTHPEFDTLYAMSWQNQKNRLVIKAVNKATDECEYLLADINDVDAPPTYSTIKSCNSITDRYATLDKDGRFLYYTILASDRLKGGLVRYDLKTSQELTLVPGTTSNNGPELPLLSPDGKKLAYLLFTKQSTVNIYLKDLLTLDTKLIFESKKHKRLSYALDWVDNNSLRYIDYDQMLTFDSNEYKLVNSEKLPNFVLPLHITHKSPTDIYFTTRNFFLIEMKQINSFDEPEEVFNLYESKQNSLNPIYDNVNHNYFFISLRSGQAQIWMGNGSSLKQLTDFKGDGENPSFLDINITGITADGNKLIYSIRDKYWILNISTGKFEKIEFDIPLITLTLGADSQSFIYIDKQEPQLIKQYDFVEQTHKLFSSFNAEGLLSNNKGMIYAITEEGLFDLSTEKMYSLPENIKLTTFYRFKQVGKYFYAIYGNNKIYRWKENDLIAEVISYDSNIISLNVTDKQELIISTLKKQDIKIEQLSW